MSTPVSPAAVDQSGPKLSWVLGGAAVLSIVFGVLSYRRYAMSEAYVAEGREMMDEAGKRLDAEGCIDAAIDWHAGCEDNDTNQAVCNHAVKLEMYHCLKARDRSEACVDYAKMPDKGKWVYRTCDERGMRCINKKECACAEAYRALESFCRTDQEAVQM